MDEKNKTWTLRFPAKENPNMEKALFDWPIVLQYDVKAKYRLISRKFFGHEVFSPERSLNQPKARCVCIRSINQSNRFISVLLLFLFCSRVFISRSYENRSIRPWGKSSYTETLKTQLYVDYRRFTCDFLIASKVCETKFKDFCHPCTVIQNQESTCQGPVSAKSR